MDTNDKIVKSIVEAMKYTVLDYLPDFEAGVSKDNHDGIYLNVWAKRCNILMNSLKDVDNVEILHIPRGIFQFDPVLDLTDGILYVAFSKKTLVTKQREYKKHGITSHYLYSLLNINPKPKFENLELIPASSDDVRKKSSEKMLKVFSDKVKKIIVIAVDYESQLPITAHMYLFDSQFNTREEENITKLLISQLTKAKSHTHTGSSELPKQLVSLRDKQLDPDAGTDDESKSK